MNNSNGGKRGGMLERWSGSDPDFGSRVILWIDVCLVLLSACQLENKTITRQATRSQRSGFEQTIADKQSWFVFLPSGHYVPLYHMYNKGEGQMSNTASPCPMADLYPDIARYADWHSSPNVYSLPNSCLAQIIVIDTVKVSRVLLNILWTSGKVVVAGRNHQ